ncbi:GDP-mannose 4,6-dehydratase [Sessilibacter corallicola]|uniref:GDP-mannose 4,6-dehydratase n=1 Tax=Sessilibacter corallicola TaxID=2904075 RepID=UPI001E2D488B|nr:GDP-mannose 4,6-dehydratase [Sessilibacter corallicola]
MAKTAIVTGVTGQDGAYLSQLLIKLGYEVYGAHRRLSSSNFWRLEELDVLKNPAFKLVEFDLTDLASCISMVQSIKPDEVYNLAAQSFVGVSFSQPVTTSEITGIGALNLLEAIRIIDTGIKYYQASTSEMFGKVQEIPQTEATPFYPRSPYGVAKLYAHWMTVNYRESYDIFASSGILFNHESPLRGLEFVTRKITDAVAKIYHGKLDYLEIGNLDAKRDWGYAKDYVKGMHMVLQHSKPDTFVLATNKTLTVRDFISLAFSVVGEQLVWDGEGINELAHSAKSGKVLVKVNPQYYRPCEVELLIGDYSKAENELGWVPDTSVEELCRLMVEADLERNRI